MTVRTFGRSPSQLKTSYYWDVVVDLELLRLRDENFGLRTALVEANSLLSLKSVELDELRAVVNDLNRVVAEMHTSRTWRVGQFVLFPIRLVRRMMSEAARG